MPTLDLDNPRYNPRTDADIAKIIHEDFLAELRFREKEAAMNRALGIVYTMAIMFAVFMRTFLLCYGDSFDL